MGYLLGRLKKNFSRKFSFYLIKIGIPVSITGILLKSKLQWPLIQSALIALLAIGLLMTILICLPFFKDYIQNKSLILGSGFGNTGYFGIPVSLALLPKSALVYSMGFDIGATFVIWIVGPMMLSNSSKGFPQQSYWRNLIKTIFSSPAIKGLAGALIIWSSPWNEKITTLLWIPSRIVILLALMIVGMRLSFLRKSNFSTIKANLLSVKNALFLKLIGLPVLMLIISSIIRLPSIMRNALVLQAAAPTAISVLLISQAASRDEDEATSLVVFSTISALITIPSF